MSNLFLWAFTLLLFIGNIYSFAKKKYLFLFVPCMLFLPEYYGIEISASLPLLSVRRIMYIVLFIYTAINKRRNLSIKSLNIKDNANGYFFLAGYFVLRIISNLHYITTYGQAAKTIGLLVFEQLFFLGAVFMLAPTKEEFIVIIKTVVWVATAFFVIGIFESISSIRIFDSLYTVSRNLYNILYFRLGMLRSVTTMHAPALYGNMCILVFPLILYVYDLARKKVYLVSAGLCLLAIIHSGARSDLIFLLLILIIYLLFVLKEIDRKILFLKNFTAVIVGVSILLVLLSASSPKLRYYYTGTVKSVLNEIGFDFDLDKGAPKNVEGFGNNPYGSVSRIRQLTGLIGAATENPIFGLGGGAITRGQVKYYWHFSNGKDGWITASAYDVGLVELFCEEGLVGLLGMCLLVVWMLLKTRNCNFYLLAVASYIFSSLSTKNMYEFLMLYIVLAFQIDNDNSSNKNGLGKPII